jgi:murein DD-endopeptidase MepM/ murein hydrolase activator NlpD
MVSIFLPFSVWAAGPTISLTPEKIFQGDPVMLTINSESKSTSILFDQQKIPIIQYGGSPRGLIAIDLNQTSGDHTVTVKFADGTTLEKTLAVTAREKIEEPLGIPQSLGGNTPAAATNLVTTLTKENTILKNIKTGTKAFWTQSFRAPLEKMVVTDNYGYNRKTGEYTIPHKGTDYHAEVGTKVLAMNRGVVRLARTFTIYGKTVVIDHGFGLSTMYMHLSKLKVNEGQLVLPGQTIGLSGQTGYAEVPHLHLSIRVNGISIDPVTFMSLFNIQ